MKQMPSEMIGEAVAGAACGLLILPREIDDGAALWLRTRDSAAVLCRCFDHCDKDRLC